MYEERRDSFSIKGFVLQILIILLFVFLMLWLFPTKSYINKNLNGLQSEEQLQRLEVLYGEVFANNIERMKDAAIGYFTDERLPKKVGDYEKITLEEMYEKHLVLEMKSVDGKSCSLTESYVKVTKHDNEYRFKINLKCGDKEDYIIVYMGCYTYCDKGMCEKRVTSDEKNTKGEINSKVDTSITKIPTSTKNYMYEYKLITEGTNSCTGWTEWTKTKINSSSNVEVDTKTVQEKTDEKTEKYISGYKDVKVKTGTKNVKTGIKYVKEKTGTKTEKVKTGTTTQTVITGTKKVQTGTTTKTVTEKVAAGTTLKFIRVDSGTTIPSNTSTMYYQRIGSTTKSSCTSCATVTTYTWNVYQKITVYKLVTKTETVPVYKLEYITETKNVDVYTLKTVDVYTLKAVDVYEKQDVYEIQKEKIYSERTVPVYSNITYYRSKSCKMINGGTYYKWSTNKSDKTLLNNGYVLTGNVKQI